MKLFLSTNINASDRALAVLDVGRADGGTSAQVVPTRRSRTTARLIAGFAAAATVFALSACSHQDSRTYDIAPIFPLSSNKCATYDGKADGSGFSAHCWVTKSKCEQAASDWRHAMQSGGVNDAIQFQC